ncbi:MAG: HD domain-containing protein [Desulfobacterales bacterium]
MIRITDIIDKIYDYYPEADVDIVDRAYIYSAKVHDGQLRLSGEPYLSHPLEVASILADMRMDTTSIACGLLHDVVEDTHATIENIEKLFGKDAAKIIEGVTKISSLSFDTAKARQAGNIRKMILAMADDIRVILIKLADRLHNTRTLHYHTKKDKQRRIAQETLDIYSLSRPAWEFTGSKKNWKIFPFPTPIRKNIKKSNNWSAPTRRTGKSISGKSKAPSAIF